MKETRDQQDTEEGPKYRFVFATYPSATKGNLSTIYDHEKGGFYVVAEDEESLKRFDENARRLVSALSLTPKGLEVTLRQAQIVCEQNADSAFGSERRRDLPCLGIAVFEDTSPVEGQPSWVTRENYRKIDFEEEKVAA